MALKFFVPKIFFYKKIQYQSFYVLENILTFKIFDHDFFPPTKMCVCVLVAFLDAHATQGSTLSLT